MSEHGHRPRRDISVTYRPSAQRAIPARVGRAAVVVLFVAAAVMTCRDQPTSPGRDTVAFLSVRPVFTSSTAASSFGLPPVDSIRVVAIRPVSDTALDTTVFFHPDSAVVHLSLPVALLAPTETFTVVIQLRAGAVVLYSGTAAVSVTAGVTDPSSAPEVPVSYAGPGAGITSITITPRDSVVTLGQTKQFNVGADSNGVMVTPSYVSWSTSDTVLAPISATGVLQAPAGRASVFVHAEIPNGKRDSTRVTFIPVPTAVDTVSGGAQTATVGTQLASPLRVQVTAADLLGVKGIAVRFRAVTGGGSVQDSVVATDSAGYAQTVVMLGPTAGTQTFSATVTGLPVASFAATAVAGPISAATSVVSVSSATVASGSAVTFLLQGKDAFGNNVTSGGATVVFTTSGGTSTGSIGPTTDHGDGTYTASFVGGVVGTPTTVTATVNGTAVSTALPTVTVTAGGISAATSVVSTSSALVSSGASATLTLQAKDSAGNDLATGGDAIVFSATGGSSTGTIGPTTDHGDGTYTASFLAESAGTATTIGATVNGVATVSTVALTVVPGNTVAARSVITVSADTILSGATATITLQAKDSVGNDITTGGLTVVFNRSGGTSTGTIAPSPATDNGDGTYTATFTGVLAGTATTIGGTVDGQPVTSTLPTITVRPGAIAAATSVVTVSDSTVGTGLVDTLFLQGKDAAGNLLTSGGATVVFTQTGGTSVGSIGSTTDLGNGRYRALFTGTTPGTPTTIGATVNGTAVTTTLPTIRVFATSTTHSSDITANESWTAAQSPHIVTGYLKVRSGATLTIAAGALVKFDAGAGLQVGDTALGEAGGLVMDGTGSGITLTANTASPTPGFWKGIEVQRSLAVPAWRDALIEWGGGTRPPAGAVTAEACVLLVNASGAALELDSLHVRQCTHAAIHHFGGAAHVHRSQVDSVTGSGIHVDFDAQLELDSTTIRGAGQEGLYFGSPAARLVSSSANRLLGNLVTGVHLFAAQLPGLLRQDSIGGNGSDVIEVDGGQPDPSVAAFTIFSQPQPPGQNGYVIQNGVLDVGRVGGQALTLDSNVVLRFAPQTGLVIGDSAGTRSGTLRTRATGASNRAMLMGAAGSFPGAWLGVEIGRLSGPDTVKHVRIADAGDSLPGRTVHRAGLWIRNATSVRLVVDSFQLLNTGIASSDTNSAGVVITGAGAGVEIRRTVSDNNAGYGFAVAAAPVRLVGDSARGNGAGLGVFIDGGSQLTAQDSIAGNDFGPGNRYAMRITAGALPMLRANGVTGALRDTLLFDGGVLTADGTLPYLAGFVWRVMDPVYVDSGATLTIAARDTIAFDTSAGIEVGPRAPAALAADGSSGMILMTASGPLPEGWHGIDWHLMSGSGPTTNNAFRYVDVDRAGYSAPCFGDCSPYQFAALRFTDSLAPTNVDLPLDHIIVRRSNSYALDFRRGGTGTVNIQSSQFYANLPDPMIRARTGSGSRLTIGTSDLYHYRGQAIQGIYKSADPADSVTATNNWWGDVAGVDTGFNFQDSLGRASIVFGAVRTAPIATTPFFPVGPAAGVVTTQDSVLSPNPALSTADSIRVRVVDASGRGVAGQSVSWSLAPASGSSISSQPTGETGGRIDALWSFATTSGQFVATASGPGGAARYYANVQPDLTLTGPNWVMQPALTQGTVPGAKLVTFTSTNRRGALVSNSVDQYGNATHAASLCFADIGGNCQFSYGLVDSTHSDGSAGDTIFFHTSVTQPSSFVLRGYYNVVGGGQRQDSVMITMVPTAVGVKIDRDAYDGDGVQVTPDTVLFHTICPGQPNFYCQVTYHAFVVDSGFAPVGNQSASFQWALVPASGAPVSVTPSGAVNDSVLVTALANGFVRLAVTDVGSNNYGTDTMPILVHQVGQYIVLTPDTASVLLGNTATFQATVVDAGNEPLTADSVHWRIDPGQPGTLTIVDTSSFNQATVRMDATPNGTGYLTAFWPRPLIDTLFGYYPFDTLHSYAAVYNPVATSLSVGPGPLWAAVNPVTNRIYVSQGDNNVSVIDGATNTVSQVAVGYNTFGITVNSKTNRIYAAQNYGSVIYEIDGATNAVDSMGGPNLLGGIAADSTRNLVYAPGQYCVPAGQVCSYFDFLAILDPAAKALVDTVRIGNQGSAVAFNPVTDRIYVTTYTGTRDTVVVIDAKTHAVIDAIEVGPDAVGIAVNSLTNRIYVANATEGIVSVIDGATDAVIATVSIIGLNSQPFGLGVDPATNRIYVSTYFATSVLVIDGATNQVVGQIPVGDSSTDAQPNPVTGRVYVPLTNSSVVKAFRYQ